MLLCDTKENLGDFLPVEADREGFLEKCKALGLQKIAEKMVPGVLRDRKRPETPAEESSGRGGRESAVIPAGVLIPVINGKYPVALALEEFCLTGPDEGNSRENQGRRPFRPRQTGNGESAASRTIKEAAACLGSSFFPLRPFWISRPPTTFCTRTAASTTPRAVRSTRPFLLRKRDGFSPPGSKNSQTRWGTTKGFPPSWSRRTFPSFLSS